MKIAIIKYNAGNIMSVQYALARLGYDSKVTDEVDYITSADKVIFPGVGEAQTTMSYLRNKGLDILITGLRQPVLGICLGQQLMCSHSEEGDTPCLGIFNTTVKKFQPYGKIPHMGWNSLHKTKGRLFENIQEGDYVYFVHSFYVPLCESTSAECNYINVFSAALEYRNFYATQFHPEKSGDIGHQILKNFIAL